jgi:hypothetical protein
MDSEEDTEPRKFFCFDGCMIKMDKNVLEVEVRIQSIRLRYVMTWHGSLTHLADQGVDEWLCAQRNLQVHGRR